MLCDLARNDVHRVCQPETVKVDDLMKLEKFSHVIHLTSQISGVLRDDQSRFDAFRSIFPAGTVSGAPKLMAIKLVGGLEKERRGIYAGAVGRFDYAKDSLDTAIAIRTMTYKDGIVYLQAGGGIVFDSDEADEYQETINKLGGNLKCIDEAESKSMLCTLTQNTMLPPRVRRRIRHVSSRSVQQIAAEERQHFILLMQLVLCAGCIWLPGLLKWVHINGRGRRVECVVVYLLGLRFHVVAVKGGIGRAVVWPKRPAVALRRDGIPPKGVRRGHARRRDIRHFLY